MLQITPGTHQSKSDDRAAYSGARCHQGRAGAVRKAGLQEVLVRVRSVRASKARLEVRAAVLNAGRGRGQGSEGSSGVAGDES